MESKILIADDESDIVSMLGSFFESKGFRVLPAFNGAEALKQVEKQPDIILLDINMPGTDGLEVCKRIRDHISCPILFLTARIEDTDKVKGFTVGGDDYIPILFPLNPSTETKWRTSYDNDQSERFLLLVLNGRASGGA